MTNIMRKYFSGQTTYTGENGSTEISTYSLSLGVYSFGGLFIVVGAVSLFSLLLYVVKKFPHFHWTNSHIVPLEGSLCLRFIELVKNFNQKYLRSWSFWRNGSTLNPTISPEGFGVSPGIDDMQKHSRTSSEGADDVATDENDEIL